MSIIIILQSVKMVPRVITGCLECEGELAAGTEVRIIDAGDMSLRLAAID